MINWMNVLIYGGITIVAIAFWYAIVFHIIDWIWK